jgi:short-subunit dehydrogenase
MAGWIASAGMVAYATSKFGLRGFSEGLFNELKDYQIKVTVVYPFFSRTPLLLSKRYGKFADENKKLPKNLITNPTDVMRRTIQGIVQDKKEVFPDIFAQSGHVLKSYFPFLLDSGFDQLLRRLKKDAG